MTPYDDESHLIPVSPITRGDSHVDMQLSDGMTIDRWGRICTWPKLRLYDVQTDVAADYPTLENTDEPT